MERAGHVSVTSANARQVILPDTWGPDGPQVPGKGRIDAHIAERLDRVVTAREVRTRFVRRTGSREIQVLDLPRLKVACVVRNLVAPDFARRYGRREGEALRRPVEEFYHLAGSRPMMTESHLIAFAIATPADIHQMMHLARELNVALIPYLAERSLKLVDATVHFARDATGELVVDNEVVPETIRLWDALHDVHYDLEHLPADPDEAATHYRALGVILGVDDKL